MKTWGDGVKRELFVFLLFGWKKFKQLMDYRERVGGEEGVAGLGKGEVMNG